MARGDDDRVGPEIPDAGVRDELAFPAGGRRREMGPDSVQAVTPRRWGVVLLLAVLVVSPRAAGPTITIDAGSPAGKVSPLFAGLMTEEINHAYDGGLY